MRHCLVAFNLYYKASKIQKILIQLKHNENFKENFPVFQAKFPKKRMWIDYKNDQKNSQKPQDYYRIFYFQVKIFSRGKFMLQI